MAYDELIYIRGSYGSFGVDPKTGEVVDQSNLEDDEYIDIVKVDLDEWRLTYPDTPIYYDIDILDIGFWTADGKYAEPCQEYRDDMAFEDKDNDKLSEMSYEGEVNGK